MSVKTIESRLAAKPESLKYLWELMTLKNTPLINELLAKVPNHPDFEEWFEKGTLPQKPIKELCAPLRDKEPSWKYHKLYLQCSVDTRLWTQEGTELIAEQKAEQSQNAIALALDSMSLSKFIIYNTNILLFASILIVFLIKLNIVQFENWSFVQRAIAVCPSKLSIVHL